MSQPNPDSHRRRYLPGKTGFKEDYWSKSYLPRELRRGLEGYQSKTYDPVGIGCMAADYLEDLNAHQSYLLHPWPEDRMFSTIGVPGMAPVVSPTGAVYVAAGASAVNAQGYMVLVPELTTNVTVAERTLDVFAERLGEASQDDPMWFDRWAYRHDVTVVCDVMRGLS